MENLSQQLSGNSLSEPVIELSLLATVVEELKSRNVHAIAFSDLQNYIIAKMIARAHVPTSPASSTESSPAFTFKTPSKMFSPVHAENTAIPFPQMTSNANLHPPPPPTQGRNLSSPELTRPTTNLKPTTGGNVSNGVKVDDSKAPLDDLSSIKFAMGDIASNLPKSAMKTRRAARSARKAPNATPAAFNAEFENFTSDLPVPPTVSKMDFSKPSATVLSDATNIHVHSVSTPLPSANETLKTPFTATGKPIFHMGTNSDGNILKPDLHQGHSIFWGERKSIPTTSTAPLMSKFEAVAGLHAAASFANAGSINGTSQSTQIGMDTPPISMCIDEGEDGDSLLLSGFDGTQNPPPVAGQQRPPSTSFEPTSGVPNAAGSTGEQSEAFGLRAQVKFSLGLDTATKKHATPFANRKKKAPSPSKSGSESFVSDSATGTGSMQAQPSQQVPTAAPKVPLSVYGATDADVPPTWWKASSAVPDSPVDATFRENTSSTPYTPYDLGTSANFYDFAKMPSATESGIGGDLDAESYVANPRSAKSSYFKAARTVVFNSEDDGIVFPPPPPQPVTRNADRAGQAFEDDGDSGFSSSDESESDSCSSDSDESSSQSDVDVSTNISKQLKETTIHSHTAIPKQATSTQQDVIGPNSRPSSAPVSAFTNSKPKEAGPINSSDTNAARPKTAPISSQNASATSTSASARIASHIAAQNAKAMAGATSSTAGVPASSSTGQPVSSSSPPRRPTYTATASTSGSAQTSTAPPPPPPTFQQSSNGTSKSSDLPPPPPGVSTTANSNLPPAPPDQPLPSDSEADNSQKMANLAELYRKQGKELYSDQEDYERALDCFDKALKFAPPNWNHRAVVLGNRAAVYFMLDRYMECVADCEAALLLDSKLYRLHVRRGKAMLRVGDLLSAEESLTRVLEVDVAALNAASGQKLSSSVVTDLETAKTEARTAIKTISGVKASIKQLTLLEARDDHKGTLRVIDDLLPTIPYARLVHGAKCRALVKMQRFQDTKAHIESVICNASASTLGLFAHPAANLSSAISPETLEISEAGVKQSVGVVKKNTIIINNHAIVNALLTMGHEMAKCYIPSIKNIDECRTCCADVMDKICQVLSDLNRIISSSSVKDTDWMWVQGEYNRVKSLIDCKNIGDRNFRASNFADAAADYFRAIQIDKDSPRWSAILYSNRAAALMGQRLYSEAVSDCHSAIVKDPGHYKVYLRRARAHAALLQYPAAVRDYRMYLSAATPFPDAAEVKVEMESVQEQQRKALRENQQRQQQQKSTSSSPKHSFGPGGATSGTGASSQHQQNSKYPNTRSGASGSSAYSRPSSSYARQVPESDDSASDDDDDDTGSTFPGYSGFRGFQGYQSSSGQSGRPGTTGWGGSFKTGSNSSSGASNAGAGRRNSTGSSAGGSAGGSAGSSHKAFSEAVGEESLYSILGISKTATERQIKTAYRQLALKYHPDKNKDEGAEDMFKSITGAYSTLSDKASRDKYDREQRYR